MSQVIFTVAGGHPRSQMIRSNEEPNHLSRPSRQISEKGSEDSEEAHTP